MDKAPTVINIMYEIAEDLADDTPPPGAFLLTEGYRAYVDTCERRNLKPMGERGYADHLERQVKAGILVKRKYRVRNYYWAASDA